MTALQKLIEKMNHMIESGDDNLLPLRIHAVNLLEKEKEQMIDAYNHCCTDTLNDEMKQGKQYYNETYK